MKTILNQDFLLAVAKVDYSHLPKWRFIERFKQKAVIDFLMPYCAENLIPNRWVGEAISMPMYKSKSESEE